MKSNSPDPLLRLPEVLSLIPVGRSTFWQGVREGRFPKPVKLGPRTTCWRQSDIVAFIKNAGQQSNEIWHKPKARENQP